eukprot:TRINITY_DN70220_c0_g1_i1.p1 TRINITY_DN70220_c0_g1~~TRINITY_DN70220_c0_g1_i1.p1  ORF type:complete len:380 (-),score=46.48 TRINITY_DN70220_c0_g1_i1:288-1427(-)
MQRACRWLCVDNIDDTQDDVEERVGAYQAFLGNLMTVSTLLLGFIVTGTLLSMTLTGEENYTARQMVSFVTWAGLAALLSMFATLISFLVSGNASQVQANRGADAAIWYLRYHTVAIFMGEIMVFASIMAFLHSLKLFLDLNYLGPDICPWDSGIFFQFRANSFCSLLGGDMYAAAGELCTGAPATVSQNQELCNYYGNITKLADKQTIYGKFHDLNQAKAFFGWAVFDTPRTQSQDRLKLLDAFANHLCWKNEAKHRVKSSCGGAQAGSSACDQARATYLLADSCASDKQHDMDKCYNVCAWAGATKPTDEVYLISLYGIVPAQLIMLAICICRLFSFCRQLFNVVLLAKNQGQSIFEPDEPSSDEESSPRSLIREEV